jgi:hypothetical protein
MKEKPRTWELTDINPNILREMDQRSTSNYADRIAYDRFTSKESIKFAEEFETGYLEAIAKIAEIDTKGETIKKYKIAPLAPKLNLFGDDELLDVLDASKMGGIPDLRRQLQSGISHDAYVVETYKRAPRTPAQILQNLWPKDANGEYMMFVGQTIIPPHISVPWDYFVREKADQYADRAVFEEYIHRNSFSQPMRSICFFVSPYAPFDDPRLDCAKIHEQWYPDLEDEEDKLMSESEYLVILAEAIPEYAQTHFNDSTSRWSHTCFPVNKMEVGFDLDIISNYDWPGAPDLKVHDDLVDGWLEYCGGSPYPMATLFGAPESQQTPKRFCDPCSYQRPMTMRPWLNWSDRNEDFTWQLYYGRQGMSLTGWGKVDGSCT